MRKVHNSQMTPTRTTAANTAAEAKADVTPVEAESTEKVQLTAIETKLVKTAELLKAASDAISANVRNAREAREKLASGIDPLTVFARQTGTLDDADNRDKPVIADMQAALDNADMPVNMAELVEMVHLVVNTLKAPDLDKLLDPEIKGEADKLRDVLKGAEYLDAGESIINTAKLAIGVYDASVTSLRDWQNKGKASKTGNTPGPTSMPMDRDNVDMASKLRSTDKVRERTGWDVEYVCGDHRTTHGDALGSVKHYIRAKYREANNLDDSAAEAGTREWADLGPAITQALTSGENVEWGNGYIHRVAPGS